MMRRFYIYIIFLLIAVGILLMIDIKIQQNDQEYFNEMDTILTNIMLEKARLKIKYDTSSYNFSQSGVNVLEDLVMESGGKPERSVIVSTWRSGSSFMGELVQNTRPGTYYYYEPLFKYVFKQFRTLEEAKEQLSIIKQMLQCNFEGLQDVFDFERKHYNVGTPGTNMWAYCKFGNNNKLCFNANYASRLCKLFPFVHLKIVRLRLGVLQEIFDNKTLNIKTILLVRDPRGVMQSRQHRGYRNPPPDYRDPSKLCADMVSDYMAARRLLQQYPDRLMVVRFEELALQINATSERILNFFKVQRTQAFEDYLQSHTNVKVTGAFSTFRVSSDVPYKWTAALDFNYVNEIQMACGEAMHLWGYKMALDKTHMTSKDFNPVDDYTI